MNQEFWLFAIAFFALFCGAGAAAVAFAWLEYDDRSLLSREEWELAAKLIGIVLLLLVLIQFRIAVTLPAGQFIYGRF